MKKNIAYSMVAFLVLATYLVFGGLTQLLMGTEKWGDAPLIFGVFVIISAIIGGVFYIVFSQLAKKFWPQNDNSSRFVLSRNFILVSTVLIVISSAYGISKAYSISSEKLLSAKAQKEAVEAERLRIAALSPEQRTAEENMRRLKADAAAKEAKEKVAKIEAEKAKVLADKKKRDAQLSMAAIGAATLKRAMKDPEAFDLKSVLLMPNGTACYEYRAKNSFGAILPGSAVLTSTGKMFSSEHNRNTFVSAWNKNCTVGGGEEISTIVKMVI